MIDMAASTVKELFTPLQLGAITLKHRVVMAPLMLEYYTQRASDGGFIVSEATSISPSGRGWFGAPALYSDRK